MLTDEDQMKLTYDAAIKLICYQGQLIWSSFHTLLFTNSVLVGLAAFAGNLFPKLRVMTWIPPAAGILLCIAWFLTVVRNFAYYKYWFAWGRELEKPFEPARRMISIGKTYSEGGSLADHGYLPRFGFWARIMRIEWLMMFVILIFILETQPRTPVFQAAIC
jgi:hypothetical protein